MKTGVLVACLSVAIALTAACADGGPTAVAGLASPAPPPPPSASVTGPPDQAGVTTGSGATDFCGLSLEFTVFNAGASWEGPSHVEARRNVLTLTNPLNGRSVRVPIAGRTASEIVAFHGDGSFTVREEFDGVVSLIQAPTGPPLSLGAGRLIITFRVIPVGGDFVLDDLNVVFDAGPHPAGLELGAPTFCDIVVEALS